MTTIKAIGKELVLKADQNITLYPQENIWISQGTKLIFEGTAPDEFEAKLQATSVTADRDIILPDSDGTIATQEWVNLQGFGGGGGGGGSSAITIQDEGSPLSTAATTINFVGTGVVASGTGATKTITISSASGIAEVSSDTTPQLGGDLDLNSNNITGTGDINIAGTITSTSAGTPTLTSSTDINLQAGTGTEDRVEVIQSPFKVASFTTAQRDTKISENGDVIYNTTTAQLECYQDSSWSALRINESEIALGKDAGSTGQAANAIAIGEKAGYANQAANAIAIGEKAGYTNQAANSIVINATGTEVYSFGSGLVITPIRSASGTTTLMYDASTGEITHTATPAQQTMIGSVQQISGPGAIDVTSYITEITTTGADAYTLADGVAGQIKIISMIVDGGDATITPTTLATGTTITMADVNDNITLLYGTNGWVNTANQGSIIA